MADFDPDAYLASTSSAGGSDFDPDTYLKATEPGFLSTVSKNIGPDLKGIGEMIKTPWPARMTDIAKLGGEKIASGESIPSVVGDAASSVARPVTHPVEYAKEHPVQQFINLVGVLAGMKGLGGAKEAAVSGVETPKPIEATPSVEPPAKIEPSIAEGAIPKPEAPAAPVQTPPQAPKNILSDLSNLTNGPVLDKAKEIKDYIGGAYETAAKKPGFTPDLADYAQEKSQLMAVKAAGGSPLFATQGIRAGKTPIMINNELRAIGQYMLDNDIVKPELGNKVMLETQEALQESAGARIRAIRELADKLHEPTTQPVDVLQAIHEKLGEQYGEGMPGSSEYKTALGMVEKSEPSFEGAAEVATKLNKLANKANRNFQPHTPYTDVANAISEINNERIKAIVGPEKAAAYEQALREFGVNKKIQNMLGRKVGQGLHRTGPGSLTRAAYQKFMDEVGYKGGAKVMNKMAGTIKSNPSVAKSLPSLFKSFINEVEDILPDREQGMAEGGVVEAPDINAEVHRHIRKEYDPTYQEAV